jgi:hypothetical protein
VRSFRVTCPEWSLDATEGRRACAHAASASRRHGTACLHALDAHGRVVATVRYRAGVALPPGEEEEHAIPGPGGDAAMAVAVGSRSAHAGTPGPHSEEDAP